jgi:glutathione S-transferase
MLTLHYSMLCPKSRVIRLLLNELKIEFNIYNVSLEEINKIDFNVAPHAQFPILQKNNDFIFGLYPLIEYLTDLKDKDYMLGNYNLDKSITRTMIDWCSNKFHDESVYPLIKQKILLNYDRSIQVDSTLIRTSKNNLRKHLAFLEDILTNIGAMSLERLCLSDLCIAVYISYLDYLNEIDWIKFLELKQWYSAVKSRPSFKFILEESFKGLIPASQFKNLDF